MSDIKKRLRFHGRFGYEDNREQAARKAAEREEAADHIEQQEALIASLRKDAERYRKIRATTKAVRNDEGIERIEVSPEDFDTYIDKLELKAVSIPQSMSNHCYTIKE